MDARITADDRPTSFVAAEIGREPGQNWPQNWFECLVKSLWPVKGAVALTQYAEIPDRTARNYQNGHSEPPASVLRDLLRGDEGYRVLKFVMAGSTTTWWIVIQHERELAALARNIFSQLDAVMK